MKNTKNQRFSLLAAIVLGGLAMGSLAADDKTFPGVRRLMSEEDFEASGLGKLSAEEIEALDAWLLRYTAGDATVLQKSNKEVRKATEEYEFVSRITGEFTGWSGKTVFRLENGQVWKQRLDGRYRHRGSPNPEVRIDRNWLGFYRMTVIESGRSVGVSPR